VVIGSNTGQRPSGLMRKAFKSTHLKNINGSINYYAARCALVMPTIGNLPVLQKLSLFFCVLLQKQKKCVQLYFNTSLSKLLVKNTS